MTRRDVFLRILRDLEGVRQAGLLERFALCGGLALAVWGTPRATLDVDFLVLTGVGLSGKELGADLLKRGWRIESHVRDLSDPVPEVLRCALAGTTVDLMVAHRTWERAVLEDAATVDWHGTLLPSLRPEALAAMKLRAGGPQDLVDADRLSNLPGFDAKTFANWKRRLRVP